MDGRVGETVQAFSDFCSYRLNELRLDGSATAELPNSISITAESSHILQIISITRKPGTGLEYVIANSGREQTNDQLYLGASKIELVNYFKMLSYTRSYHFGLMTKEGALVKMTIDF